MSNIFRGGDDQKTITQVAKSYYGGYPAMFKAHGWPETGAKLMTAAAPHIVREYGSVKAFEETHRQSGARSPS